MGRTRSWSIVLVAAAVAVMSGCSASGTSGTAAPVQGASGKTAGGWNCPGGACQWSDGSASARGKARSGDSLATAGGAPVSRPSATQDLAAPLATSVDDNARWTEYLRYLDAYEAKASAVETSDVRNRTIVTVTDAADTPVRGADLDVRDKDDRVVASVRTMADGRAVFFPTEPGPLTLSTSKGGAQTRSKLDAGTSTRVVLADAPGGTGRRAGATLDVMFLLDATGSMQDEIDQLRANIGSIATRIEAEGVDARFGLTLYRDQGDLFVTRVFDFTNDRDAFAAALDQVVAGGGGDTPEDLTAGLHAALDGPSWRGGDALSLVVLVGDAPPHVGGGSGYLDQLDRARAKGVKVLAVGAPGLDASGQYVFRQLGVQTLGRFVSLVGPSSGGNRTGSTTPVGPDDLGGLPLDELVSRLITDELHSAG